LECSGFRRTPSDGASNRKRDKDVCHNGLAMTSKKFVMPRLEFAAALR
jgi:hypothetical protein